MSRLMLTTAIAVALAACGASPGEAQSTAPKAAAGAPVQTGAANTSYKAAFPGQTRAPEARSNVAVQVQTYVDGLERPWGMAFLPNGALLVTEKAGRLRVFENGKLSEPVAGVPQVDSRGQGGLLGLAIDPDYARNGTIYFAFSEPDGDANRTAVAKARLVSSTGGPTRLEGVQVIWRQAPSLASRLHFGGRIVVARDGTLFITTGDRSNMEGRVQSQKMDSAIGKVIRINRDGSVPRDNPFVGRADAKPEIWSIGHRNPQAAALHPRTGELWTIEHGPRGGDEINITRKGRDYGWPTITYGIEYGGGAIGQSLTQRAGMEQPIYYWDPVIAPSGMAFYQGSLFPTWRGSLFVGGLGSTALVRLALNGDKVVGEERLLRDEKERIRDVIVGPDGAIYLATDNAKGRVLRVSPK